MIRSRLNMIIADTGFWLALANRNDKHHEQAKAVLNTLDEPLITTWPVLTETCHLLLSRLGAQAQERFMAGLSNDGFEVFPLEASHAPRMVALMAQYRNLPMDLADASLVVLAETLGHGRILSTDERDLESYRWKRHHPFENLLHRR